MSEVIDYQAMRREVLGPFYNWDGQIAFCYSMEGWEASRVKEAVAAFTYLRQVFGEKFPDELLELQHPMGHLFVNNVPWTKEWFIRLAQSLQGLAKSHNISKVIKDLRSKDIERFEDAVTLLHYGFAFLQAGYQVDFEQRVVNRRGKTKYPDVKITDRRSGAIFYCEMARLVKDPRTKLYESVIDRIVHGGLHENKKMLKFSGALHQSVSEKDFVEIAAGIQQLVKRTARDRQLHQWVQEGLIELAVADYHDPAIQDWATAHKQEVNAWRLPPVDSSIRTKRKIWHKADQAARDFPTFLIIKIEDGSFRHASPAEWIQELDETMRKCEDVIAVWLTIHEFGGWEKAIQNIDTHYFMKRTEGYALGSLSLIIFNRYYKNAASETEKWFQLLKEVM